MTIEKKNKKIYLGLVHYPIKNKKGEKVVTSVTNMDIHDISRSCRTFGVKNYFLITPLQAQHDLVNRILGHWEDDKGSVYNPDRSDALSIARLVNSIEEAKAQISRVEGVEPKVVVTGANFQEFDGEPKDVFVRFGIDNAPILLLFGTGWGLLDCVVESADFKLAPIYSQSDDGYNHLSVRSAVAIYLDRFGQSTLGEV